MASAWTTISEPAITGEITVTSDMFPQEVLQEMMAHPGSIPVLTIEIPKIWMTEGVQITSDYLKTTIRLQFATNDITIKPA